MHMSVIVLHLGLMQSQNIYEQCRLFLYFCIEETKRYYNSVIFFLFILSSFMYNGSYCDIMVGKLQCIGAFVAYDVVF